MDDSAAHVLPTMLYYCKAVIPPSGTQFWHKGWLKSMLPSPLFSGHFGLSQFLWYFPVTLAPSSIFQKQLRKWQFIILPSLFIIMCEGEEWHFLPLNSSKRQTTYYSGVLRQIPTPDMPDMQTIHFLYLCSHGTLSLLLFFLLMMKHILHHSSLVSLAIPAGSHGFSNLICLLQVLVGPK